MIERWPNIFVNTNHDNHPLRQGIYSAYVEWLEGKETTDAILKRYISIREYAGEKTPRFTSYEQDVFEQSIPKNTSPHKQAFEDLAIRIGTSTTSSTPTSSIPATDELPEGLTAAAIEQQILIADEKGVHLSKDQIVNAWKRGKNIIIETTGIEVQEPVEVEREPTLTEKKLLESLGYIIK